MTASPPHLCRPPTTYYFYIHRARIRNTACTLMAFVVSRPRLRIVVVAYHTHFVATKRIWPRFCAKERAVTKCSTDVVHNAARLHGAARLHIAILRSWVETLGLSAVSCVGRWATRRGWFVVVGGPIAHYRVGRSVQEAQFGLDVGR